VENFPLCNGCACLAHCAAECTLEEVEDKPLCIGFYVEPTVLAKLRLEVQKWRNVHCAMVMHV
jgi:hypothetical protein